MNGFVDLHVSFGDPRPPRSCRLGNEWSEVASTESVKVYAAEPAGIHRLLTASSPSWRLWGSGAVFSYRNDHLNPLGRFADDLAQGLERPDLLDAHAVLLALHEESGRLSVWTDRMGTVHAYHGGTQGQRAVGTFFGAVREHSNEDLDWLGITGFCGFGFYPADRTPFTDMRIIRPATRVVFDRNGAVVEKEHYWDWWYDPDRGRNDDDFVDEFHDIWTRTVTSQLRGTRSVVPLSGGLDSRTIFAVAAPRTRRAADPVRTLTYGYSAKSPEIRISRRVAAARGHSALELVVGPYLLDRMSEVTDAVEGFQSLAFSRQAGVSQQITALGDHVMGGHWGDVWFDVAGTAPTPALSLAAAGYEKFAKRGRQWLLERVCRPNLGGDEPDDLLRDLLASEAARIPEFGDDDMRLKALKTEQWSFRWTLASVRAYQLAVPTLMPFYANEVVDFFLRVPSARLRGRRLQKAYLRRHHPDLARIPWQNSGMSLFEKRWEPASAWTKRAVSKLERTARHRPAIERNWEVQYFGTGRTEVVKTLLERAGTLATTSDGVSTHELDELLGRPDAARGYTLDALMTLCQSIRNL